jgi:hypothetical protein
VRPAQFRLENVQRENGVTRVPISLAPYASCFIVFNKEQEKTRRLPAPDPTIYGTSGYEKILEIAGPWKVRFPENRGAPGQVELNELVSWTDHPDPGVKYFSGTASYHHKIQYEKTVSGDSKNVFLDLGEVRDVAEVIVNGVSAGILWTKPFAVDIGPYLKDGENDLQINITNMWVNRLTGDMDLPPEERICKTNQPFIRKDNWAGGGDETYHLQDAGLMGPVRLVTGTHPGQR